MSEPALNLGVRVRILAAGDITGVVTEHTRYLDGSVRWGVSYWHSGKREFVSCAADELAAFNEGGRV